eukprot:m.476653 g.476653  ORF g.476653 m.476653 type:complete len:379 (-) comp41522_c0_seq1:130-1266(-)
MDDPLYGAPTAVDDEFVPLGGSLDDFQPRIARIANNILDEIQISEITVRGVTAIESLLVWLGHRIATQAAAASAETSPSRTLTVVHIQAAVLKLFGPLRADAQSNVTSLAFNWGDRAVELKKAYAKVLAAKGLTPAEVEAKYVSSEVEEVGNVAMGEGNFRKRRGEGPRHFQSLLIQRRFIEPHVASRRGTPWTVATHHTMPPPVRRVVVATLRVARRLCDQGRAPRLPPELWDLIFGQLTQYHDPPTFDTFDPNVAVYLAAVLEYVCTDIVQISTEIRSDWGFRLPPTPESLWFSIIDDREFWCIFGHHFILKDGVLVCQPFGSAPAVGLVQTHHPHPSVTLRSLGWIFGQQRGGWVRWWNLWMWWVDGWVDFGSRT